MALFYASTGIGACIREARDIRAARAAILREVGEYNGVREVRKATEDDIAWVKGMGGHVPGKRKAPNVELSGPTAGLSPEGRARTQGYASAVKTEEGK